MKVRHVSADETILLNALKQVRKGKITNVAVVSTKTKSGRPGIHYSEDRNHAHLLGLLEVGKQIICNGFVHPRIGDD